MCLPMWSPPNWAIFLGVSFRTIPKKGPLKKHTDLVEREDALAAKLVGTNHAGGKASEPSNQEIKEIQYQTLSSLASTLSLKEVESLKMRPLRWGQGQEKGTPQNGDDAMQALRPPSAPHENSRETAPLPVRPRASAERLPGNGAGFHLWTKEHCNSPAFLVLARPTNKRGHTELHKKQTHTKGHTHTHTRDNRKHTHTHETTTNTHTHNYTRNHTHTQHCTQHQKTQNKHHTHTHPQHTPNHPHQTRNHKQTSKQTKGQTNIQTKRQTHKQARKQPNQLATQR